MISASMSTHPGNNRNITTSSTLSNVTKTNLCNIMDHISQHTHNHQFWPTQRTILVQSTSRLSLLPSSEHLRSPSAWLKQHMLTKKGNSDIQRWCKQANLAKKSLAKKGATTSTNSWLLENFINLPRKPQEYYHHLLVHRKNYLFTKPKSSTSSPQPPKLSQVTAKQTKTNVIHFQVQEKCLTREEYD